MTARVVDIVACGQCGECNADDDTRWRCSVRPGCKTMEGAFEWLFAGAWAFEVVVCCV